MAEYIGKTKGFGTLANSVQFNTYVPDLGESANIQNAFELFYFGDSTFGTTTGDVSLYVAAVLRQLRPRLVLTHHRDQPHPDHTAAADIVGAAVYLAGLARWHPSADASPHRPATLLSFGLPHSVTPSFIVDISDWAERKSAAIRCHRSQFGELLPGETASGVSCQSFLERVEARQRHYGSLVQVRHGEAFHVRGIPTVDDPVKFFSRPMDILP